MQVEYRLDEAARIDDCEPRGTLESWKENVAERIDPEWGWHFAFAAMIGCAGPLLRPAGLPSSAFYLHGPSSGGKSLAQAIQTGIWGNPALGKGLCHTCRSTPNAIESLAIRGNDTTLAMDEARNAAAGSVGEFVFMFASGRGKNRSRRDGSGLNSARHEWLSLSTLSGEEPLELLLQKYPRPGTQKTLTGHAVRMPTILIPEGQAKNFEAAVALEAGARANYGHVGIAFVRHLFAKGYHRDASELLAMLEVHSAALAGDTKSVPKLRAVRYFALVQLAGELMREIGLFPERINPEHIVRTAWSSFADSDASNPLDAAREAADAVLEWLHTHPANVRPVSGDVDVGADKSWQETWAWYSQKTGAPEVTCFYVRKDRLLEMYGGTVPRRSVLKQLRDTGVLVPMNEKNHDNVWTRLPDGRQSPVKHYRLEIQMPLDVNTGETQASAQTPLELAVAAMRHSSR